MAWARSAPRQGGRCTCTARNRNRGSCRSSSRAAGGWRAARGTCRGPTSGGRTPPLPGDRMSKPCSMRGRLPTAVGGSVRRSRQAPRRARELRESVASASPSRGPARRGIESTSDPDEHARIMTNPCLERRVAGIGRKRERARRKPSAPEGQERDADLCLAATRERLVDRDGEEALRAEDADRADRPL